MRVRQLTTLIQGLLQKGVTWWITELVAMVPARLRLTARRGGHRTLQLQLREDAALIRVPGGGGQAAIDIPVARVPDDTAARRVQAALRRHRIEPTVVASFAPSLVFETDLELPLAAEKTLPQVLRHQLDRIIPLDPSLVVFASAVTSRSTEAKMIRVRATIAKQETIREARVLAEHLGLRVDSIVAPASRDTDGRDLAVLWRVKKSFKVWLWRAGRRWMPEIAAVAVLCTIGLIYVDRLKEQRTLLQTEIASLKEAATSAANLRSNADHLRATLASIETRRATANPLEILSKLTRLVPLDSWVFQLSVHGRAVDIAGYSPHAPDLISRIEDSSLFEKPRFRSPIMQAADGKGDRFDLSFQTRATPHQ